METITVIIPYIMLYSALTIPIPDIDVYNALIKKIIVQLDGSS
jgi:hypothetical protein